MLSFVYIFRIYINIYIRKKTINTFMQMTPVRNSQSHSCSVWFSVLSSLHPVFDYIFQPWFEFQFLAICTHSQNVVRKKAGWYFFSDVSYVLSVREFVYIFGKRIEYPFIASVYTVNLSWIHRIELWCLLIHMSNISFTIGYMDFVLICFLYSQTDFDALIPNQSANCLAKEFVKINVF